MYGGLGTKAFGKLLRSAAQHALFLGRVCCAPCACIEAPYSLHWKRVAGPDAHQGWSTTSLCEGVGPKRTVGAPGGPAGTITEILRLSGLACAVVILRIML